MRVASVDAVTGHTLDATLSTDARGTSIKGSFVTIRSGDDLLLGRVVSVDLTNIIHKDETFAPYIMEHGAVPHWSGAVDIERAKIGVVRAIDADGVPVPMRRNPASGTDVSLATNEDIDLFRNEREHVLFLGDIPNSGGLRASIINRHHGDYASGGYGEARHTAVFGQNGSGKTVLATMRVVGQLAAHRQMGLLMPDTAGDLSDASRHNRADFRWNYLEIAKAARVDIETVRIQDIRLSSPTTLKLKMGPFFASNLNGMASEKAAGLADRVVEALTNGHVVSSDITADKVLDAVVEELETGSLYARSGRKEKADDAIALRDSPRRRASFERALQSIQFLFDGREEIGHLITGVLERGRKVIIDLAHGITAEDQAFVMREVMSQLSWRSANAFKSRGGSCNALVVLDEGRRWVPEGTDDPYGIGGIIKQALRETRKYGLGWMIVAQSPSGVSKDVLREAHTMFFGRGLGVGADRKHLEDCLGKDGAEAYEQLEIQGGYFWVGIGLDNNIGTESSYFSLHPFGGDATKAFISSNPLIFS